MRDREGARQRGDRFPGGADRAPSTAKGGARCWRWSWPTGKAHRRGRGFFSASRSAACRRRVRRLRRSPGSQEGDRRSPSRGLAALLRALSQAGPHAEKTRRRLPAGTAPYDRRDIRGAARSGGLADGWQGKYPTLTDWVEDNIEETLAFYRLPRQHHKHLKSDQHAGALQSRSSGAPTSCASFPTARAACA